MLPKAICRWSCSAERDGSSSTSSRSLFFPEEFREIVFVDAGWKGLSQWELFLRAHRGLDHKDSNNPWSSTPGLSPNASFQRSVSLDELSPAGRAKAGSILGDSKGTSKRESSSRPSSTRALTNFGSTNFAKIEKSLSGKGSRLSTPVGACVRRPCTSCVEVMRERGYCSEPAFEASIRMDFANTWRRKEGVRCP